MPRKVKSQRGSGRTINVPKTSPPNTVPGPSFNGAVTIGEACNGPWCSVPVTPTTTNMTNQNLLSANPPPGANVQYPGTDRLGNNWFAMPGVSEYVGTQLNPGPFNIQCTGGQQGGRPGDETELSDDEIESMCSSYNKFMEDKDKIQDSRNWEKAHEECNKKELCHWQSGDDGYEGEKCVVRDGQPKWEITKEDDSQDSQVGGQSLLGDNSDIPITMFYSKIVNPETGRKVSVFGNTGKKVLKKYLTQMGGF